MEFEWDFHFGKERFQIDNEKLLPFFPFQPMGEFILFRLSFTRF